MIVAFGVYTSVGGGFNLGEEVGNLNALCNLHSQNSKCERTV